MYTKDIKLTDSIDVKLTAQFIDLVNSTLNAEHLSQRAYVEKVLVPFQDTALKVKEIFTNSKIDTSVRGDEVFLYFYDENSFDKELTFKLIDYFILLRTIWHLEDYNANRIKSSKSPIDIGGGLNNGMAILFSKDDKDNKVEGYTINKTKRIEGLSREGVHLRIVVSHSVKLLLEKNNHEIIIFSEKKCGLGKGLADELEGYEVKEYYSDNLFSKIREYYIGNIDKMIGEWEELSNQLHLLAPRHYWFTNLFLSYQYYRFETTKDVGLLKIAVDTANKYYFLDGYFMPNFVKAYLSFYDRKYEKAFYLFDKCLKSFKSNKVRVPRLLSALELLKDNFAFFDSNTIRELRSDYLEIIEYPLDKVIIDILIKNKNLLFK